MNSPFGSSNQGGFRQQPQQQNFGQQGGFGVQTAGTFGGFQPQQQSFGFGGGQGFGGFQPQQSFGGFGGGQGFGGFNPFQGGYGGFQPQQQFNPFQGGYGGGFQPQGFGGGFNPMFGGIGGLGFNPMMGPQFGMPMQGFNPYQQTQNFGTFDMMYRGGPQMPPEMHQRREQDMRSAENEVSHFGLWGGTGEYDPKTGQIDLGRPRSPTAQQPQSPFTGPQRSAQDILNMAVGNTPKDMQYDLNKDGKITSADALAYQRQYGQQTVITNPDLSSIPEYRAVQDFENQRQNQPYTPEMGQKMRELQEKLDASPAFQQYLNEYNRRASEGPARTMGDQQAAQFVPQRAQQTIADYRRQPMYGGIGGLGFNPMMGPQFGMPMQGMGGYGGFNPYQPQQDVARRRDQMPPVADPTRPLSEQQWSAMIEGQKARGAAGNWRTYQDYVRNFKTPEQTQDLIRQRQALTMELG